jgi:hypothetical protein
VRRTPPVGRVVPEARSKQAAPVPIVQPYI